MALIPPFFLDCVVAIGFDSPTAGRQYAATGFLYGKLMTEQGDKKTYQVFLVTNKHVVQDAQVAWLRFNPEGEEPAREFGLRLSNVTRNCATRYELCFDSLRRGMKRGARHHEADIDMRTCRFRSGCGWR